VTRETNVTKPNATLALPAGDLVQCHELCFCPCKCEEVMPTEAANGEGSDEASTDCKSSFNTKTLMISGIELCGDRRCYCPCSCMTLMNTTFKSNFGSATCLKPVPPKLDTDHTDLNVSGALNMSNATGIRNTTPAATTKPTGKAATKDVVNTDCCLPGFSRKCADKPSCPCVENIVLSVPAMEKNAETKGEGEGAGETTETTEETKSEEYVCMEGFDLKCDTKGAMCNCTKALTFNQFE